MTHTRGSDEAHVTSGLLNGPLHDDRVLVFDVRDSAAVHSAVAGLTTGADTAGGFEHALRYVARHAGIAKVTPLFPEHARGTVTAASSLVAIPDLSTARRGLSGLHYLRLADAGHGPDLVMALRTDPRIAYAHHPVIQYPLTAVAPNATPPQTERQWALGQCKFRDVWDRLDRGDEPGPIGVIDTGSPTHPELRNRVTLTQPLNGAPSRSIHASAVAGVISAIRGNDDEHNMEGCCSAKLNVYNVWNDQDFDAESFYSALKDVAARRLPVLNLSLGSRTSDATTDRAIRECIDQGVTVIAAMGDYAAEGSPPVYPAANADVIAVGGTDRADRRTRSSSVGSHVWISAPSDDIWTLHGNADFRRQSGTSFASAMVSAAAWLAWRGGRRRTPQEMRDLLRRSVDGVSVKNGWHNNELGYGRLDMVALARLV
jgi:hypothetical protein